MRDVGVAKAVKGDLRNFHALYEAGEDLCQGPRLPRPDGAIRMDAQKDQVIVARSEPQLEEFFGLSVSVALQFLDGDCRQTDPTLSRFALGGALSD